MPKKKASPGTPGPKPSGLPPRKPRSIKCTDARWTEYLRIAKRLGYPDRTALIEAAVDALVKSS